MATKDWTEKALGALRRYRVMAIVTGVMLLILVVEMLLKYVLHADDVVRWIEWVPYAHGWIYVVYLVTVMDLWSTMRWSFGRLVQMVLAGVVPIMSFVVEHSVHAQGLAQIETGRPAQRRKPAPAAR